MIERHPDRDARTAGTGGGLTRAAQSKAEALALSVACAIASGAPVAFGIPEIEIPSQRKASGRFGSRRKQVFEPTLDPAAAASAHWMVDDPVERPELVGRLASTPAGEGLRDLLVELATDPLLVRTPGLVAEIARAKERLRADTEAVCARIDSAIPLQFQEQVDADPQLLLSTDGYKLAAAEISAATGLSVRTVTGRLDDAYRLCGERKLTLAAMEQGHLTVAHARVLCRELMYVSRPDVAALIEEQVLTDLVAALERGRSMPTPSRIGKVVEEMRHLLDGESVQLNYEQAIAERRTYLRDEDNGMATFCAEMTKRAAVELQDKLTALAGRAEESDPRSIHARRVDVLLELFGIPPITPTAPALLPSPEMGLAATHQRLPISWEPARRRKAGITMSLGTAGLL